MSEYGKPSPFEYIDTITWSKKNLMRGSHDDKFMERHYPAFFVNKMLSYYQDTVLIANEMNLRHGLSNRPQYEFLINMVRKRKRRSKTVKPSKDDLIDLVCRAYQCNRTIAHGYFDLLTPADITSLKEQEETGGMNNGRTN